LILLAAAGCSTKREETRDPVAVVVVPVASVVDAAAVVVRDERPPAPLRLVREGPPIATVGDDAQVYFAVPASGQVLRLDRQTLKVSVFLDGLQEPTGLAQDLDAVYVADRRAGTIIRAEKAGDKPPQILASQMVEPTVVAMDERGLFVAAPGQLYSLSTEGGVPKAKAALSGNPRAMALDWDTVFVTLNDAVISVARGDGSTHRLPGSHPVVSALAVGPEFVFVSSGVQRLITRYAKKNRGSLALIDSGEWFEPASVRGLTPFGRTLLACTDEGSLRVNVADGTSDRVFDGPCDAVLPLPENKLLVRTENKLWVVANQARNRVLADHIDRVIHIGGNDVLAVRGRELISIEKRSARMSRVAAVSGHAMLHVKGNEIAGCDDEGYFTVDRLGRERKNHGLRYGCSGNTIDDEEVFVAQSEPNQIRIRGFSRAVMKTRTVDALSPEPVMEAVILDNVVQSMKNNRLNLFLQTTHRRIWTVGKRGQSPSVVVERPRDIDLWVVTDRHVYWTERTKVPQSDEASPTQLYRGNLDGLGVIPLTEAKGPDAFVENLEVAGDYVFWDSLSLAAGAVRRSGCRLSETEKVATRQVCFNPQNTTEVGNFRQIQARARGWEQDGMRFDLNANAGGSVVAEYLDIPVPRLLHEIPLPATLPIPGVAILSVGGKAPRSALSVGDGGVSWREAGRLMKWDTRTGKTLTGKDIPEGIRVSLASGVTPVVKAIDNTLVVFAVKGVTPEKSLLGWADHTGSPIVEGVPIVGIDAIVAIGEREVFVADARGISAVPFWGSLARGKVDGIARRLTTAHARSLSVDGDYVLFTNGHGWRVPVRGGTPERLMPAAQFLVADAESYYWINPDGDVHRAPKSNWPAVQGATLLPKTRWSYDETSGILRGPMQGSDDSLCVQQGSQRQCATAPATVGVNQTPGNSPDGRWQILAGPMPACAEACDGVLNLLDRDTGALWGFDSVRKAWVRGFPVLPCASGAKRCLAVQDVLAWEPDGSLFLNKFRLNPQKRVAEDRCPDRPDCGDMRRVSDAGVPSAH